jgi:hypothetical protein
MTDITATMIADSIGEHSPRLHTQRWRHPKFNHQEALRHRKLYIHDNLALTYDPDFSFSVSSSRAIPFKKMLAEVTDPSLMAKPVYWGEAQKGMSPGGPLDDRAVNVFWPDVVRALNQMGFDLPATDEWVTKRMVAERLWTIGARAAAWIAEVMDNVTGIHKSVPNRMVENYVHVNCLVTGTEPGWMNFFGLRLDAAADPTLRALAEQAWAAWCESEPKLLRPGAWHLPYADDADSTQEVAEYLESSFYNSIKDRAIKYDEAGINEVTAALGDPIDRLKKMSVARCAHLSYEALDTGERLGVVRCLDIVRRLNPGPDKPLHASPFEHQATPDVYRRHSPIAAEDQFIWNHPDLAGNLGPGWIQLRRTLPNEAVAPLPEAYQR